MDEILSRLRGTLSDLFSLRTAMLKSVAGILQIRNTADNDFATIEVKSLYIHGADTNNKITLTAPSSMSADEEYILPPIDGANGNMLTTNGVGALGWSTPTSFVKSSDNINTRREIHNQTLIATASNFDINIPSTANNIVIEVIGRTTGATTYSPINLEVNADTSNSNYHRQTIFAQAAAPAGSFGADRNIGWITGTLNTSNSFSSIEIKTFNLKDNLKTKHFHSNVISRLSASATFLATTGVEWKNTSVVTSIKLTASAGDFAIGSICRVYEIIDANVVTDVVGLNPAILGTMQTIVTTKKNIKTRQVISESTLVSTGNFTVTVTPTMRNVEIHIHGRSVDAAEVTTITGVVNGDTTATNYKRSIIFGQSATGNAQQQSELSNIIGRITGANATANSYGYNIINLYDTQSDRHKNILATLGVPALTANPAETRITSAVWLNTSVITSFVINGGSGGFAAGSRIIVYSDVVEEIVTNVTGDVYNTEPLTVTSLDTYIEEVIFDAKLSSAGLFSSIAIPSGYDEIRFVAYLGSENSTFLDHSDNLAVEFNGDTNTTHYRTFLTGGYSSTSATSTTSNSNIVSAIPTVTGENNANIRLELKGYDTTIAPSGTRILTFKQDAYIGYFDSSSGQLEWSEDNVITSVYLKIIGGWNFKAGSWIKVSGYKKQSVVTNVTGSIATNLSDVWDVGDIKTSARTSNVSNKWVLLDNRSIGNASSNATSRANNDMQVLYEFMWNNFGTLIVQNSSGNPVTRGTSSLSDWNSNRRILTPDARGRVVAMMDNPSSGAGSANVITGTWADSLGGVGGSESHVLGIAEMPAHTHGHGTGTAFSNSIAAGGTAALSAGTTIISSTLTASTGGGTSHNNIQPSIAFNFLMYTGN